MSSHILIVDDEKNIRTTLARSLSLEGYGCSSVGDAAGALEAVVDLPVDLVMLDVMLPDGDGLEVLKEIKAKKPDLPVVIMSGHGSIDMALEAIRGGAHDFIEKPLAMEKILITLGNALAHAGHTREIKTLRARFSVETDLIGDSVAMARLRDVIGRAAPTRGRVLITGESGTGKELVARALHRGSRRAKGPFIKLNCAAIPSELIESELFGHERGAFTGAHQMRRGKFELANGGTLLLDEIGDMRTDVQAKLLRALQEEEIERVGGGKPIKIDVRVIAATHRDLEAAIAAGEFREDLYYRLNVVPLHVPPLRAHLEDVPALTEAFVTRVCQENDLRPVQLSDEAKSLLAEQPWPGNVRELRNACERLVILSSGSVIGRDEVSDALGGQRAASGGWRPATSMKSLVAGAERAIIEAALNAHDGNVSRTAESLEMERSHLYKKMKALGMR